jgi:hypothetical protein
MDLQRTIDGLLALPAVREAASHVLGAFSARIRMLREQVCSIESGYASDPAVQEVIQMVRDAEE